MAKPLDVLDRVLKKIEEKICDLDIYNGPSEAKAWAKSLVYEPESSAEGFRDHFIEAVALKALDPHADTVAIFKRLPKHLKGYGEIRTGAVIRAEMFDAIVGEAVSEFRHGHLKASPRTTRVEQSH